MKVTLPYQIWIHFFSKIWSRAQQSSKWSKCLSDLLSVNTLWSLEWLLLTYRGKTTKGTVFRAKAVGLKNLIPIKCVSISTSSIWNVFPSLLEYYNAPWSLQFDYLSCRNFITRRAVLHSHLSFINRIRYDSFTSPKSDEESNTPPNDTLALNLVSTNDHSNSIDM